MILFFQEKVEVIEQYDVFVHSSFNKYQVPCIIRLKSYVKRRNNLVANFSRSNVFRRDNFTCQYCYKTFVEKELTLDHVIPVSRGGPKTWSNIVTACKCCNQKKADKTPDEARMKLLSPPTTPSWKPDIFYEKIRLHFPKVWRSYLRAV